MEPRRPDFFPSPDSFTLSPESLSEAIAKAQAGWAAACARHGADPAAPLDVTAGEPFPLPSAPPNS